MTAKKKIELEYPLHVSPKVLFTRLSTPGGLSEWFADDVNLEGNVLTFFWEKSEQKAEIVCMKENRSVRFKWLDDEDQKSYFEFRITQDDLTGDVSLHVTDFADDEDAQGTRELWNKQINHLKVQLGSLTT